MATTTKYRQHDLGVIGGKNWVDFDFLKKNVNILDILRYFDVTSLYPSARNISQYRGVCPFCQQSKDYPFSVNTEKNTFNCFSTSCKKKGDIIALVVYLKGYKGGKNKTRHMAATFIKDIFVDGVEEEATLTAVADIETEASLECVSIGNDFPIENVKLPFELNLDSEHESLKSLGFSEETIEKWGLGFCSRGMHEGKIAFPIRDPLGDVIAYGSFDLTGALPMPLMEALGYVSDNIYFGNTIHKIPSSERILYPKPENFNPQLELFGVYESLEDISEVGVKVFLVQNPIRAMQLSLSHNNLALATLWKGISERQINLLKYHHKAGKTIYVELPVEKWAFEVINLLTEHYNVIFFEEGGSPKNAIRITSTNIHRPGWV